MRVISMPIDFVDLRKSPININDIENNVREFYDCLDFDEDEDIKTQCLDARSYLDTARLLLRNLISPEENHLMTEYNKAYIFMQENLGRVDKRLNTVEDENIEDLQVHERNSGSKVMDSPFIRRYVNSLLNCMNHLVYYPIKNALQKFNKIDTDEEGNKIIKSKELFLYFVFLELLHSSESMGSITAERGTKKTSTVSPVHESTGKEGYSQDSDLPPSLPEDLPTEEEDSSIANSAEDFFNPPVEEDEEKTEDTIFEDEAMEITEEKEDD